MDDRLRERVRGATDLAEVVRESGTELQERNGDLWGCCPLHGEETASFHVRGERPKQFFKCFGCGEGGDVFKFVMLRDGVGFREALETLASRAGIEMERAPSDGRPRRWPRMDTDGHGSTPDGKSRQPEVPMNAEDRGPTDDVAARARAPKPKEPPRGCTLARLGEDKGLDVGFLRGLGCSDMPHRLREKREGEWVERELPAVRIPYYDERGQELPRFRIRLDPTATRGSRWSPGKAPLRPYGLDRLVEAGEMGFLIIAEGESDCWSLWATGFPALGIPGASAVAQAMEGVRLPALDTVYVCREPDGGGERFARDLVAWLAEANFAGEVRVIRFPVDVNPDGEDDGCGD